MHSTPAPWIRWPGYLAWVFLAMLPLAVLTVRAGEWQRGLLLYALCCLASLLLLAWFGVLSLLPRLADRRRGLLLRALPAIPGSLLLVMVLLGRDVPPIHDITTDTANPPQFEVVPGLRSPTANSLAIDDTVIARQRAAYPDLATLHSALPYPALYAAALDTARAMGWEIVRDDPNAGYIEAVARTAIMNFTDDVAIRVSTGAEGSQVDLRSASRVGISDLGANAARIRAYLERLRTAVGER
jgi:hypothetical protein